MILYRIAQKQFIRDLSGMGAYLYGGRWSLKGTYALYTASSRSLAYLEYIVHQFERNVWPVDLMIASIEIPDNLITHINPDELPENWMDMKYNYECQTLTGDRFRNDVLALSVPSVIIPQESNIILNPTYPLFSQEVNLISTEKLTLDKRLKP